MISTETKRYTKYVCDFCGTDITNQNGFYTEYVNEKETHFCSYQESECHEMFCKEKIIESLKEQGQ